MAMKYCGKKACYHTTTIDPHHTVQVALAQVEYVSQWVEGPSAQVATALVQGVNNIQLQPPPPPNRTNTALCSNHCNLHKGTRIPYKPLCKLQ